MTVSVLVCTRGWADLVVTDLRNASNVGTVPSMDPRRSGLQMKVVESEVRLIEESLARFLSLFFFFF